MSYETAYGTVVPGSIGRDTPVFYPQYYVLHVREITVSTSTC